MKPFDLGLVVGRFNSFHLGHCSLVDLGLSMCDRVIVIVGSSQESGTLSNPFSVETRMECIKAIYGDRVIIGTIADEPELNLIQWGQHLLNKAKLRMLKYPEVMIFGNDADDNKTLWFDADTVQNMSLLMVNRQTIPISGTKMREFLVKGDVEQWFKYSHPRLHKFYGRLRDELLSVDEYQKMYGEMKRSGLLTNMQGQVWD